MRRSHSALLLLVVAGTVFSLGCSSVAHWQFALAKRFEQHGKPRRAYQLYESALAQIPANNQRWISDTYFHLGECLWALGEPGEAFEHYVKAVDADGNNSVARLRLGEVLLAGGAPERAGEQAAAVLSGSGGNVEALALLGAASTAAGQDKLAESAFKRVLDLDPGRVNIAIALADIYNRLDRVEEARAVLHKAASAQPQSAMPLLALGRLEEQEGNGAGAEEAYRQAVAREDGPETNLRLAQFLERSARVDEAERILQRVDGMRPQQPTALPDFELAAGRAPSALERYTSAIRSGALQRRGPQPSPELLGDRASLAARIVEADLQAGGDAEGAARIAQVHLEQFRAELDGATVAILQAEIALAANNVSEAEQRAQSATELAPKSAASHYILGVAHQRAGNRADARTAWLDALQQDSGFVPARLALAADALHSGDSAGAEQFVLPVVRDEPANLRALVLYARVLMAQQRWNSAAIIANRAAAVDSSSAEPHILLGELGLARKNYAEALLEFERGVLQEPRSPEALDGLIRVYRKGAITRDMLRNMEQIASDKPDSPTLMEIAGRLYAERGWYPDAERCLRRALSMDPQRTTAAAALAQMFASHGDLAAAAQSASRIGGKTAALLSGISAQDRQDTASAIAEYETAVREGDHSGVAANNLAWLYAQQGRELDRALTLAEKARALAPNDPAVLDTVGVVHLRRREYSDAIDALKSAAAMATSSAVAERPEVARAIRKHLAEAYARAGMQQEAAVVAQSSTARPRHSDR